MQLKITNIKGVFEIQGRFTKENTSSVKEHFNYLLDHYQEIIMCLKKVSKIDQKAIEVLHDIYSKSVKRGKILFVLGHENENIIKAFQRTQTTHIFRNDY